MSVRKIGDFNLNKTIALFEKEKRGLPRKLGNIAKNHFLMSFRKRGFTDSRFVRWQPRRKRLQRGRTSRTQTEDATLIKSGALRRSVRVTTANFRRIRIATDGIIYDRIHNEGLRGLAFGRNRFTMPQRRFMGNSRILERKLEQKIFRELNRGFR